MPPGVSLPLGALATERKVKRLSANGELAKYRIVHFATHGVLAGQLDGANEPGLILTPPDKATEEDDGYLSASEIAALKLDADWVILSACNTAAGSATSAEAQCKQDIRSRLRRSGDCCVATSTRSRGQ